MRRTIPVRPWCSSRAREISGATPLYVPPPVPSPAYQRLRRFIAERMLMDLAPGGSLART
jgi:hypothetical protein